MIKETEKEGEKVQCEHGRRHGSVRSDACECEGKGAAMGADKQMGGWKRLLCGGGCFVLGDGGFDCFLGGSREGVVVA